MSTASEQYFIQDGVRRCVVARELGLPDIEAIVYEPGKAPVSVRLNLTQLHSPKAYIPRDLRYIKKCELPARSGSKPPPITVEPLGMPGQPRQPTPLMQVALR